MRAVRKFVALKGRGYGGLGSHSRDSPGLQACLPDSTVCLHDCLAIYGGRYASIHLYMCYIHYTQHLMVKSHYHIKAEAGKVRYF